MDFLIESQIKVYPTVGDFPATGAVKTLYIDESTSTTYYWTGSAYSEIRTEAKYEAIDVLNGTGSSQPKMTVCYLKTSSSSANTPEILLANANSEATSSKTIGLLLATLANGATGKLITSGEFDKFDTSAYNVGDRLWLATTDGQMTTTVPSAPNHAVFIGIVTRKQSNNGRILVAIQNGYELQELHNVSITTPTDGQALMYEAVTQLWKNKTIASGITIGTTAITSGTVGRVLFEGTGNVVQESANLFWDNTNGRLGVGTSTPNVPLEVNGTARINTLTIGLGGGQVSSNTALGFQALNANTTAIANTMVGYQAGLSITTSQAMTGIGYLALRSNAAASTAIGCEAMSNSTSALSVAIGANAMYSATGSNNVAIGQRALIFTTSGAGNTAIGRSAGEGTVPNTTGANNIFIGNGSCGVSATESNRTWIGNATTATTWLAGNVLINTTTDAGYKLDVNGTERVTGGSNIQTLTVGLGAGAIATNTALGFRVLEANTTGGSNTGVGYIALLRTTTGSSNVALGGNVLQANITGSNNVGVGFNALKLITANHNVGVGTEVLSAATTGQANTAIGNFALNLQTTGSNNVGLGYNTQSGNFSGCVIIGRDAVATANNQFVVGSTGTNAGSVTSEVNASTQVWNVIINGVARKILLA